jgi:2-dehydro-3-deoxyphosphogluconate aldolase/(4S)-4-hydroxy-2-oxoglutarate aldolase
MSHNETLARIVRTGILPVVRARSGDEALRLVDAVREGGIDVIELTMSVPGAVEVIRELTRRLGDDVLVGAGTVLDAETARACMLAGARFVVSPSLDLATIACCRTYAVPVMPGALTPTEIVTAWKAGASMVKVFPCGAVGGASYVKALKAPLPQIDLVPTGGVTLANVEELFAAGASANGAGADLTSGSPEAVTDKARQYVRAVERARAGSAK